MTLTPDISGTSGINAIAHAVEVLYAENKNPATSSMAKEGFAKLARALPTIAADPQDMDARTDALAGASLCGQCLANGGMALHHKLCHTLGGSFDLPRAAAYNAKADPLAMQQIAEALGAGYAPLACKLHQ